MSLITAIRISIEDAANYTKVTLKSRPRNIYYRQPNERQQIFSNEFYDLFPMSFHWKSLSCPCIFPPSQNLFSRWKVNFHFTVETKACNVMSSIIRQLSQRIPYNYCTKVRSPLLRINYPKQIVHSSGIRCKELYIITYCIHRN